MRVTPVGFGGMRFKNPENLDESAELVLRAYRKGINYFDTAPGYFGGKSEEIFGRAFREMLPSRDKMPFYVSTKSSRSDPDGVRSDLETSLQRMGLTCVDVLHVWCVKSPEEYRERKARGVLKMCERLREEGMVRHIAISTHMPGDDIAETLRDYPFDGVLLGYSAMNFPYREAGVAAAGDLGIGLVVMNPLGGGMIPQNPERFAFLRESPDEGVVPGALRFLMSDPRITVALVGMAEPRDVDAAVDAAETFRPFSPEKIEQIRSELQASFDALCTGCRYCEPCPQGVPIAKLMDAYNQYEFSRRSREALLGRLRYHWGVELDDPVLHACVQCGRCEALCTQKLPIEQRLQQIADIADAAAAKG